MEDDHIHVKCTDLGKRYSGTEGYIIPVTIKKVTNNMPWYPETKINNDTIPEKYDNIIEEAENDQYTNTKKIYDQNKDMWWKFKSYFLHTHKISISIYIYIYIYNEENISTYHKIGQYIIKNSTKKSLEK